MKKLCVILAAAMLAGCAGAQKTTTPDPNDFAKGADISWITEYESLGKTFADFDGNPMECTALMKQLGLNSIRMRVWVDPR